MKSLVLLMMLSVSSADAGQDVGNGGKTIVCNRMNEQNEKVPYYVGVLDLFEAQFYAAIKSYALIGVDETDGLSDRVLAERVIDELKAVDEDYHLLVRKELEDVVKRLSFLSPGIGLNPISDSFHMAYPKFCEIRQLARYTRDAGVLVDQDIWNLLDQINRAALLVHEAVYKVERDLYGSTDSIVARKIVAFLFSKAPLTADLWRREIRPAAQLQFFGPMIDDYGVGNRNTTHTYTLRNVGGGMTSKIAIAIVGANSANWAIDPKADECSGKTLDPGATCSVRVVFLAGQNGQMAERYTATLEATAKIGGRATSAMFGTNGLTWAARSYDWAVSPLATMLLFEPMKSVPMDATLRWRHI